MCLRTLVVVLAILAAPWPSVWCQIHITGTILDSATGLPIQDAEAILMSVTDPESGQFSVAPPVSTTADVYGNFEFNPDYLEGFQSKEVLLFAAAASYGFDALRLDLDSLAGDYRFELRPLVPVSGAVRTTEAVPVSNGLVGVVYVDETLKGATVGIPSFYQGVFTDGDGRFTTWVSTGFVFTIEAFHEDHLPSFSPLMKVGSPQESPPSVEIELGVGLRVTGRLVDETGNGLSGLKLRLISKGQPKPYRNSRAFRRKMHQVVTTSSDGEFVFRGVLPGNKNLIVDEPSGTESLRVDLVLFTNRDDLLITKP